MTSPNDGARAPESYHLPVVTPSAVDAVLAEVDRSGWESCRTRTLLDAERENPVLLHRAAGFLAGRVATAPGLQQQAVDAILVTHRLLAEQARQDDPISQSTARYRLPKMGEEIVLGMKADVVERGSGAVLADMMAAGTDNPLLVTAVMDFARSRAWSFFVSETAMQTTHYFLKRQAAADAMNRLFFGPPTDQS